MCYVFYTYSTSPFGLAACQELNNYMGLMATLLGSTALASTTYLHITCWMQQCSLFTPKTCTEGTLSYQSRRLLSRTPAHFPSHLLGSQSVVFILELIHASCTRCVIIQFNYKNQWMVKMVNFVILICNNKINGLTTQLLWKSNEIV